MIPKDEATQDLPYSVFQRKDNGRYALRFTLPDRDDPEGKRTPQYRIGLKTKDKAEAYRLAAREYERASIRHEEGLMVGPARFDNVAKSYVEKLLSEGKGSKRKYGHARHARGVVERYLIPCFGDAAIGAIRPAKIAEYKCFPSAFMRQNGKIA